MPRDAIGGSLSALRSAADHLLVEQRRWAGRRVPRSHRFPLGCPSDTVLLTLRLERHGDGGVELKAAMARGTTPFMVAQ
jgi:hypothetical protein